MKKILKKSCNKIQYRTRKTAWKYAIYYFNKFETRCGVYRCYFCHRFHLSKDAQFQPSKKSLLTQNPITNKQSWEEKLLKELNTDCYILTNGKKCITNVGVDCSIRFIHQLLTSKAEQMEKEKVEYNNLLLQNLDPEQYNHNDGFNAGIDICKEILKK